MKQEIKSLLLAAPEKGLMEVSKGWVRFERGVTALKDPTGQHTGPPVCILSSLVTRRTTTITV